MANNSLIAISDGIQELLFKLDQLEEAGEEIPSALMDQVNELVTSQSEKVDSCASYVNYSKQMIDFLKKEKKQLDVEIKKYERAIDRLKYCALVVMEKEGLKKLEGIRGHSFSKRTSKAVEIEDLSKLPGQFTVLEPKPDKVLIKETLQRGEAVPGAFLKENTSVTIK